MFLRVLFALILLFLSISIFAQEKFTVLKDLRGEWMTYEEGSYQLLEEVPFTGLSTVYFQIDPRMSKGSLLRIESDRQYFIFLNGKVLDERSGVALLDIDSLLKKGVGHINRIAIHQNRISERDLVTEIVTRRPNVAQNDTETAVRPYSYFRDFVVVAGFVVILLFLVAWKVNPKLASDYFSVIRMLSHRDVDDGQVSTRLTGGSNVQFYILCSLVIGFYLIIVLYHLPSEYALPARFHATGFWMIWLQWLKLSAIIFFALLLKVLLIFSLTRLFGMSGMARFHFFNWIRLLLVVIGASTVFLFAYFITHGDSEKLYVVFLYTLVAALAGWIVLAIFKFSDRSGHSMFHLFSYLCATEIIPLLITVKVLFQ